MSEDGYVYYYNEQAGEATYEHPSTEKFRQMFQQLKATADRINEEQSGGGRKGKSRRPGTRGPASRRKRPRGGGGANRPTTSDFATMTPQQLASARRRRNQAANPNKQHEKLVGRKGKVGGV